MRRSKEEVKYDVLCACRIVDPVSRIARRAGSSSYMIYKLVDEGYLEITRGRASHSRRTSCLVSLTEKGREYIRGEDLEPNARRLPDGSYVALKDFPVGTVIVVEAD